MAEAAATTKPAMPEAAKGVKVTVHWLNQSRSQRIVWLLEELGVDYEVDVYHRGADMLAPAALKEVHPLGKSPVITVKPAGEGAAPVVLAESGLIVEYLVDHFGPQLKPAQWQAGKEGQVGGETAEWMRYRYYMHYAEGSLMPPLLMLLVAERVKTAPAPFLVRPLMKVIGDRMGQQLDPFARVHLDFLESELGSAPGGGPFLCGPKITAADILMSFPLQAGKGRLGLTAQKYPRVARYVELMEATDGYKRSVKKIEEVDGKFDGLSVV